MSADRPESPPPLGFWATVGSVLAAFFGVQSQANRQRDFSRGRPLAFILVGVALTLLLIGTIFAAVRLALHLAHSG
ncbi:MAG: DUF2970 domain-containing protein [Gammaproteobacteria bacterium]|nr:DUF2970 domain-containing protein [Gammaproteobacteria bacterium]